MNQYAKNSSDRRRVAVYARVSTEHEEQLSALENQLDWYKPILAQHEEWKVVGRYIDEGITGTSAKKRPEFLRMIEDASDGLFDLILTREVSRFARNTVDTLQYTRDLKAKGVEVFFINDNIRTFDGDGELRLTIMATLAQDESRKTSIRVKSGQQTSMENGVYYGNGNILGYDRVNGEMVINPEQAETVRMIFDWRLEGHGLRAIQFMLEQAGRKTAMGRTNWHQANISRILHNEFYCGVVQYHKWWTPDYLEQKKIRNFGDVDYTVIQGRHEPIVTKEEFERVQKIFESHIREMKNVDMGQRRGVRPPIDVWCALIECECGHKFNRKIWHRARTGTQYGYQCHGSIGTGTIKTRTLRGLPLDGICTVPMAPGWKLQMMAKHVFLHFVNNRDPVLELAMAMLGEHVCDKDRRRDNTRIIKQKENELKKANARLQNLIEMRAGNEITREEFKAHKGDLDNKITLLARELKALKPKKEDEEAEEASVEERLEALKSRLQELVFPVDGEDIPEATIRAFVTKIVAKTDGFDWYLRFQENPENPTPIRVSVEGTRKEKAEVSSLSSSQHRRRSRIPAKEGSYAGGGHFRRGLPRVE